MRHRFTILLWATVLLAGCGGGGGGSATGPSDLPTVHDAFLLEHNARINGGRTFRPVDLRQ